MKQIFKKSERLCHVKVIESLFDRKNTANKSFAVSPIRVIYQVATPNDDFALPKVLFSVPKRQFKRAVDRNLLKRRLREAYRLNKNLLKTHLPVNIAFLYTSREILNYQKVEEAMVRVLERID